MNHRNWYSYWVTTLHSSRGLLRGAILLAAGACLLAAPALAFNPPTDTFIVNNSGDPGGAGTPANCPANGPTGSGNCTLRDAIAAANADGLTPPQYAEIDFDASLTSGGPAMITLVGALPAIAVNVNIAGPGASQLTVSGANTYQVFSVNSGVTTEIISIAVANGSAHSGGAIVNRGTLTLSSDVFSGNAATGGGTVRGGAILNNSGGSLSVTDCIFRNNSANGSFHGQGGAIYSSGTSATIQDSTFSGNYASGATTYAGGGAVLNDSGTMTIIDSTFFGNSSTGQANATGGAIANRGASLSITNSTITGNWIDSLSSGATNGGGVYSENGSLSVANSIISGDWLGTASSPSSYDDLDDTTGNTTFAGGTGNVFGYYNAPNIYPAPSAQLAVLANYGGHFTLQTQTLLPLPGSPALCAGLASNPSQTIDQRAWPLDSACLSGYVDAGAVQTNYLYINTLADTLNASDATSCSDGTESPTNTCSLRDMLAQTQNSGSTLTDAAFQPSLFASGAGTITLGTGGTDTPLPSVIAEFNLMGPGANLLTVSGNSDSNVANIFTVPDPSAVATFYGMTLENAVATSIPSGAAVANVGTLNVEDDLLTGNQSSLSGGAILSVGGNLLVFDSTFTNNTSAGQGGAVFVGDNNTTSVINSTFTGNQAPNGGAIEDFGPLKIYDSTIAGNTVPGVGGGIDVFNDLPFANGSVVLQNSIVAGNSTNGSTTTGDCNLCGSQPPNNLIGLPGGDTSFTQILGTVGNSPLSAPVPVMAPLPDPAETLGVVCEGSSSALPPGLLTDERGFPLNPNCSAGSIDLGAVETNYTSISIQPYNGVVNQTILPAPTVEAIETNVVTGNTDTVDGLAVNLSLTGNPVPLVGTTTGTTATVGSGSKPVNEAAFGTLSIGTASTYTFTATVGTLTGVSGNFTIDAAAAQLAYITPPVSPITAGEAQSPVTLQFEGPSNGYATGDTDQVQIMVTGPHGYSRTFVLNPTNGAVTFTPHTLFVAGTYTYTAVDFTNGAITPPGAMFQTVIAQATAARLAVTGYPSPQYTGVPGTATILAVDQYGNLVSTANPTVTVTTSDPAATITGSPVTLASGTGTVTVLFKTTGRQSITAMAGGLGSGEQRGIRIDPPPGLLVNTTVDDATSPSVPTAETNCPLNPAPTGPGNCTLRDALTVAGALSAGAIHFDGTVFASSNTAAQNTITLGSLGPLDLSSNTFVHGLTTGTGAGLANLVTVNGGGSANNFPIFSSGGSQPSAISHLNITGGSFLSGNGAAIFNSNSLTVTGSNIYGNTARNGGAIFIFPSGSLVISGSTISGNTAMNNGGGILNFGDLWLVNSTLSGNYAPGSGGGLANRGFGGGATVVNSTISGNATGGNGSGPFAAGTGGGGIGNTGVLVGVNSVVTGNWIGTLGSVSSYDDIDDVGGATTTNQAGNVIGFYDTQSATAAASAAQVSTLGNYGGPTQTMMPLPASSTSAIICEAVTTGAGNDALGNPIVLPTTDERGYTRPGMFGANPCDDAGAVQTAYTLQFTTSPTSPQVGGTTVTPSPTVQLLDHGSSIAVAGADVTTVLLSGTLGGTTSVTTAGTGVATFSAITTPHVTTAIAGDHLEAEIINGPAGAVTVVNSTAFDITDLVLPSTTLATGTVGTAYSQTINPATGGIAPVTYAVTVGSLPPGLTLNASTGVISGTPFSATAGASFTITATDHDLDTATQTYVIVVAKGTPAVTVTLTAGPNPVFQNNPVTFTATVALAAPAGPVAVPSGTVTFYAGTTALCSAVTLSTGVATCTTTALPQGPNVITAGYSGDSNYLAVANTSSTSVTETVFGILMTPLQMGQTVIPGQTITYTINVSTTPAGSSSTFPTPVTFTVTCTSCSGGTWPTGVTATLTPTSLSSSGPVTLTITTTLLASLSPANEGPGIGKRMAPLALALLLLPFVRRLRRAGRRLTQIGLALLLAVLSLAVATGLSGCGSTTGFFGSAQKTYTVQVTGTSGSYTDTTSVTVTVE